MKLIRLEDIFDVKYGHSLELNRLTISTKDKGIPFVSRKMGDNGIDCYVEVREDIKPNSAGELTVALSGNGVLSTFIQERPYYTGFHIACLSPKILLNKSELLFYCACINANKSKYSYGRQANKTLKELLIPDRNYLPSWVNNIEIESLENTKKSAIKGVAFSLNAVKWKSFFYSEIFMIKKGERLTKAEMLKGDTPFVGSSDSNNGVTAYVGQLPIHKANTISLSYNGSVGEAFYQPVDYWATDDVNVLYPKFKNNSAISLFICALIRCEKYRYNYGRKWTLDKMNKAIINLPVNIDGSPDFDFMEKFIKSLPYSSQIK